MSKELQALERIKEMYKYFITNYRGLEPKLMICEKEDFGVIETALNNYEEYKSRENNVLPNDEFIGDLGEHTRDEVAMKLKALEIIKKKMVNTAEFIAYVRDTNHNYESYLLDYSQEHWYLHIDDNNETTYCLTKEEFDLLKEVLL